MKVLGRNPDGSKAVENRRIVDDLTASPAVNAISQLDRSRAARSCSDVRLMHSSYAKFGAPVAVAERDDIACSQRSGRWRKSKGDMRLSSSPVYRAWMTPPTNPMSWYMGNHSTATVSEVSWNLAAIARWLAITFSWVRTTPLGRAVDPDVYWISATSPARMVGPVHPSPPPTTRSVAIHARSEEPSSSPASALSASIASVVSTASTRASRRIRSKWAAQSSTFGPSGGYIGTAMTPASSTAKKALMNSRPGG